MEKNHTIRYLQRFKTRKQRGVAEIIGSLLLVAITVAGATILTTFLDDAFITGGLSSVAADKVETISLNLIGYDTRDSSSLMKLVNLDNKFDSKLCGNCTIANPNKIPRDGGSEFLVIQVENKGSNPIFLSDIFLNNVDHVWDPLTSGKILNAQFTDITGKYPRDGKFSIAPLTNSPIQTIDNQIQGGQTVNLIVKLGINEDMLLNKSIRVLLNVGAISNVDLVIESGDAR